jgi:hypothetical protein
MKTISDLMTHLTSVLRVSDKAAGEALQVVTKMLALQYEGILYQGLTVAEITHASTLPVGEGREYLRTQFEHKTGQKTDILLNSLIDQIVTKIINNPRDYFSFGNLDD